MWPNMLALLTLLLLLFDKYNYRAVEVEDHGALKLEKICNLQFAEVTAELLYIVLFATKAKINFFEILLTGAVGGLEQIRREFSVQSFLGGSGCSKFGFRG